MRRYTRKYMKMNDESSETENISNNTVNCNEDDSLAAKFAHLPQNNITKNENEYVKNPRESYDIKRVPLNFNNFIYEQKIDSNFVNGLHNGNYNTSDKYNTSENYNTHNYFYDDERFSHNLSGKPIFYPKDNYLYNGLIDSEKYPPINSFNSPQVNYYNSHPLNPKNQPLNKPLEIPPPGLTSERRKSIPPRTKVNLEYIQGKNKRNVTFSKRKKGIMKKAYELSTLTGSDVLLLVASESGHVYTYATPRLKPLITDNEEFIRTCLSTQEGSVSFDSEEDD